MSLLHFCNDVLFRDLQRKCEDDEYQIYGNEYKIYSGLLLFTYRMNKWPYVSIMSCTVLPSFDLCLDVK